jgi:hypothetical protein
MHEGRPKGFVCIKVHAKNSSDRIPFYFDTPFLRFLSNPVIDGWAIQEGEEEATAIIGFG